MNALNQKLESWIRASSFFDFPGLKVQAHLSGKKIADLSFGKTHAFYDLASLTKIIFTTTYFMQAVSEGKVRLNSKVVKYLPWYIHPGVTVGDLLSHSAGNDWWQAFYKDIDFNLSPEQAFQQIENHCRKAPLNNKGQAVYSDLDFYLLGSIMQAIEGKPMFEVWKALKENYWPKSQLGFSYGNHPKNKVKDYAPTEKCKWRKKIIQGEVHDENAWALGGVAPHAGLFGRIDDLSTYGLFLRSLYRGEGRYLISRSVVRKFVTRSMPTSRGDWGFGFMLPSQKNSSAGQLMSPLSFGHTGFTGISLWYDPTRDLLVSIVSNRVHPTRRNKGFLTIRPKLHDLIIEHLEEST